MSQPESIASVPVSIEWSMVSQRASLNGRLLCPSWENLKSVITMVAARISRRDIIARPPMSAAVPLDM
jgi:hypothetical protein